MRLRERGEIIEGNLRCVSCGEAFTVKNGIPRFVPAENYASSFGFEWQRFAELQTDRLQGHSLSKQRFFLELGCRPEDLMGLRVLEAG